MVNGMDAPLKERLLAKIVVARHGCWLFQGHLDRSGYGRIGHGRKALGAHRVAYELFSGPLIPGLVIDHLCRVRSCVNPDHMEQVTSEENLARGTGYGPWRTRCKNGHEYTAENTYITPDRQVRVCRVCNRAAVARSKARRMAGASA